MVLFVLAWVATFVLGALAAVFFLAGFLVWLMGTPTLLGRVAPNIVFGVGPAEIPAWVVMGASELLAVGCGLAAVWVCGLGSGLLFPPPMTNERSPLTLESNARYQQIQEARWREAEEKQAVRQAMGKTVGCPGCNRRFVTEEDRDNHLRAKHPELASRA